MKELTNEDKRIDAMIEKLQYPEKEEGNGKLYAAMAILGALLIGNWWGSRPSNAGRSLSLWRWRK